MSIEVNATIDIMVKTSECIVFASDSRISLFGEEVSVASDTYEKIVTACNNVVLQMQGKAHFEGKTFKSFLNEFCIKHNIEPEDNINISVFISKLLTYFKSFNKDSTYFGNLIVHIAGVDSLGQVRLFGIRPQQDTMWYEKENYNTYYYGEKSIVSYISKGRKSNEISSSKISSIMNKILRNDSLKRINDSLYLPLDVIDTIIYKVNVRIESMLDSAGTYINVALFSTKDAIDYAYYLCKVTTLFDRLSYGTFGTKKRGFPSTGGDILVCVLTQHGYRWVKAPSYEIEM